MTPDWNHLASEATDLTLVATTTTTAQLIGDRP